MLDKEAVTKALEGLAENHPNMDWDERGLIDVTTNLSKCLEDLSIYINHIRSINYMELSRSEISELSMIEEECFYGSVLCKEFVEDIKEDLK